MKTSFFPNDFQFDDDKDARVMSVSSVFKEYGFNKLFSKKFYWTPCHAVVFKVKMSFSQ